MMFVFDFRSVCDLVPWSDSQESLIWWIDWVRLYLVENVSGLTLIASASLIVDGSAMC